MVGTIILTKFHDITIIIGTKPNFKVKPRYIKNTYGTTNANIHHHNLTLIDKADNVFYTSFKSIYKNRKKKVIGITGLISVDMYYTAFITL